MAHAVINVEAVPPNETEFDELLKNFKKVPAPKYRHAAPSAPWPWMDFDVDPSDVHPLPPGLGQDSEWSQYPQSLFGNWTQDQVGRCRILEPTHDETQHCSVHKVDVFDNGTFDRSDKDRTLEVTSPRDYWNHLENNAPTSNIRVRALFVENMTVEVLQILGTKYDVEPFFFASSINWIPSRYQEDPKEDGDHITVVLPFIRMMHIQYFKPIERMKPVNTSTFPSGNPADEPLPYNEEKQVIDTRAPLKLPDKKILFQDLLAIHMHRTSETSTIISYHPPTSESQRTSGKRLHSLVHRTGDSVYWSKIYKRSSDPTFVFLAILWYALYAWDEAFEELYQYINVLESKVLEDNDLGLTQELHKLQAHLLYYQQLLRDFLLSVKFVKGTHNPAMSVLAKTREEREASADLLRSEARNLESEIERLSGQREMFSNRLQNVIHLAFASVNIEDSKAMQKLAITTMIDSAAMKQISYLTMIFLPGNFLANVFSMNVREINPPTKESLAHYIEVTVGLTILTSWIVIAVQEESKFHPDGCNIWRRAFWPFFLPFHLMSEAKKEKAQSDEHQRAKIE